VDPGGTNDANCRSVTREPVGSAPAFDQVLGRGSLLKHHRRPIRPFRQHAAATAKHSVTPSVNCNHSGVSTAGHQKVSPSQSNCPVN
jgi:hypothetical protein